MLFRLSRARAALLALGFFFAMSFGVAQSADMQPASAVLASGAPAATIDKPVIDKIDPPDWWAHMPNPMLLVHGSGLENARFHVAGTGVVLTRTQISTNGHWAFLWLDIVNAPAQTLRISAHTSGGDAHESYVLAHREEQPNNHASIHAGLQNSDVLYLIMPDRFADAAPNPSGNDRTAVRGWHGGDLAGIEQHLDYLRDLGVTAIWTNPVLSNGATPDSYHGYAATDLYAIDPHFGAPGSYRHLSDALHARNMKLVMDLVPNHVSVLHPWIGDPPTPEWLHGSREHHLAVQYDLRNLVDPHAPPPAWLPITTGWFTDAMPDLNQENPLVRQYLIQNALWWVETAGVDSFRLDTFQYVGRDFWRDFHSALHGLYPRVTTVGEILDNNAEIVSYFAGGVTHAGPDTSIDTGLDTPFDYPLNFAIRGVFADDKPMTDLAHILRQDELYPHPERLVTFLDNHDTERFITTVHGSLSKFKLALGLVLTLRGTPQLYSGDEIGMPGGNDPDNRRDFPGGFPGDSRSAFTAAGRSDDENNIYRWTSALLAWRKKHPSVTSGLEQNLFASDTLFAFVRTTSAVGCVADPTAQRVLIVVNKSVETKTIEFSTDSTALDGCRMFTPQVVTSGAHPTLDGNALRIELQPSTFAILEVH